MSLSKQCVYLRDFVASLFYFYFLYRKVKVPLLLLWWGFIFSIFSISFGIRFVWLDFFGKRPGFFMILVYIFVVVYDIYLRG